MSGGISLTTILFFVFLVLKLTEVIDWSWWWVTAPLWIPLSLILIICLFVIIGLVIIGNKVSNEN